MRTPCKLLIVLAVTIMPLTAAAQQPSPALLEKAVAVLQAQRDQANNAHATAEAHRALLTDEVAKLKAEIEELKKKAETTGAK